MTSLAVGKFGKNIATLSRNLKLFSSKYQVLHLAILLGIAMLFWDTLLIYPIKLFVVMLHEMSHGLMAMAFGGRIIEIQIDERIGGYCKYVMEPSFWGQFMTASAGYLGSLCFGALILVLAVKSSKDKYISLSISLVLFLLSYFVFQSGAFFGTAMTVGLALFMLIAFIYFGPLFHDLWLKFIGITSCVYVILDIKEDLIDRSNIGSDADAIAVLTGLPSLWIGLLWMLMAILTLVVILRFILKSKTA